MMQIQCAGIICFIKNWVSLKKPLSNYGPSNMMYHYFRFFTFSFFVALFPKILWENYPILISLILLSFTFSNLLVLNWRPFQYNTNFETKAIFINVLTELLLKTLWKNYYFLMQISKVHLRIYCIANFMISNLLLLKWRPWQYNIKIEETASFMTVFTSPLWKTLLKKHCFLIHVSKIYFKM